MHRSKLFLFLWLVVLVWKLNAMSNLFAIGYNISEMDSSRRVSLGLGIGGSTIGFPLLQSNISYQSKCHVFACRVVYAKEVLSEGISVLSSYSDPFEKLTEIGLQCGMVKKWSKKVSGMIAAGANYVQGIRRGQYLSTLQGFFGTIKYYEGKTFASIGLSLESRINLILGKYFDLSLNALANLNAYKSFVGITIGANFNIPFKL